MQNIITPTLGESISEATIVKWHKNDGDFVLLDEVLLELETDKVTIEVNANSAGKLIKKVEAGVIVKVGQLLAEIDTNAIASEQNNNISQVAVNDATSVVAPLEKIASPAANFIADNNNININDINGSGKDGRITKQDVLNAINQDKPQEESKIAQAENSNSNIPAHIEGLKPDFPQRIEKMSRLRKTIGMRLKESQNNAATLTTFNEVDMSSIINFRNKYKDKFEKKYDVKLGFMSFFIKASIVALKEIPAVNAFIDAENIIYNEYYNIGVAVGTEQGLVVPVIKNADKKNFAEIEKEIGLFAKKARDGKIGIDDLSGGTFSITNGGIYGSLLSTPIINPPQSAILGMHKTSDRAVVIDGKIEVRPIMYLALSYDHRIIDGKEAVTFLVRIKESLENPERMMFEV